MMNGCISSYFLSLRVNQYIILHCICLFYVQLIKNWNRQNPLPPVLPIVIYNGDAKYDAPSNIYELIDNRAAIIKEYMPSFKYLCIDITTLDHKELKKLVEHTYNIAALLFEVEIVDEDMLNDEIHNLFEKVKDAIPSEILETLYLYFLSFIEPPRKLMKELLPLIKEKEFSMLATKIQNIRKKDYSKGLNEGIKKGFNEGIMKGKLEGKLEAKIEAFLRAFDKTNNLELSAEIAGFTIEEAQKILNERNKDK